MGRYIDLAIKKHEGTITEEEEKELMLGRYQYLLDKKKTTKLTAKEQAELDEYLDEEEEESVSNEVGIVQTQWGWM
jgi:hypothetical protein